MDTELDTRIARLVKRSDGTLEVRFKKAALLTTEAIDEVLRAREDLCGMGAYPVLVVLPADFDFDAGVMTRDHYEGRGLEDCTYAVAWDAGSELGEQMVEMFYRYFPQKFPVKVFRSEKEADSWLADRDQDR
ncbi:MAG: hypothetical protein KDC03_16440 [Flavobacteriales bacterium]|nr:hypothetical protein [Flavobacteriales bacterium]